jgi:prepilin-type N-terminal cleavage/methylation domain-containing protein
MLDKIKNRKESGFTIVEVMIVLAIAGMVILIVFLAVPALQRNSRNTQRANDAATIVAAVNECVANKNGKVASCVAVADLTPYITLTDNAQITAIGANNLNSALITTGYKCDTSGTALPGAITNTGVGTRSFALQYQVETNNGTAVSRCLSS